MKKNIVTSSLLKSLGWIAGAAGVWLMANAIVRELNRFRVAGKVILITGGSRGLGLILARHLAFKGARLAICARNPDKLELARHEIESLGAEVISLATDISRKEDVNTMINTIIDHYGKIDAVINNAGIIQVGPHENMRTEEFEEAMNVNFWGPFHTIQAALPQFIKQGHGRIVNITSIGGKIAFPHLLPYTTSKFALVGFSEGLHAELKKHNIIVTTIIPNLMRTGSPRNITVRGNYPAEYAWFKLMASSRLLSQDAESVASRIIRALEYGESEVILSLPGKLITLVKGISPGLVNAMMAQVNGLLPEATPEDQESHKGYEAESSLTQSFMTRPSDVAAVQNNQV